MVRVLSTRSAELHPLARDGTSLTGLHWIRLTALGGSEMSSEWMRRVRGACCTGWDYSVCRELVTWWRPVHGLIRAVFKVLSDLRRNSVVLCLDDGILDCRLAVRARPGVFGNGLLIRLNGGFGIVLSWSNEV